jgi:hypothetical protein
LCSSSELAMDTYSITRGICAFLPAIFSQGWIDFGEAVI